MFSVGRGSNKHSGIAYLAALVATSVACASAAHAADWYTGASTATAKPASDWIVTADASATVSSDGTAFAQIGGTMSLDKTLDVTGARLRLEGLVGTFQFTNALTGDRIKGEQEGGAILAGYEWKSTGRSFAVFGGLEVRDTQFSPVEAGAGTSGVRQGLKATVEYYDALSQRTMLYALGSYSTIDNAYYGQVKYGYAIMDHIFVGPEFAALGDIYYQEWRLGGHITGMQVGNFQFGASAGFQLDKDGKSGAYGTVNVRSFY